MTNLMSNAVKFTEDGGWVRCSLQVVEGRASLVVSDNGLGIPEAEQRDLFTRFFRSSTAHEHAIAGSGLGLTIVESIVHAHGGDISVTSRHLGGLDVHGDPAAGGELGGVTLAGEPPTADRPATRLVAGTPRLRVYGRGGG